MAPSAALADAPDPAAPGGYAPIRTPHHLEILLACFLFFFFIVWMFLSFLHNLEIFLAHLIFFFYTDFLC